MVAYTKFLYGHFGSGKTALCVFYMLKDLINEKRQPISNMQKLSLPYSVCIKPMDLIRALKPTSTNERAIIDGAIDVLTDTTTNLTENEIETILNNKSPKTLFIDEIGKWWDSRTSGSQLNRFFAYFVDQIRKRNMKFLCTDQHYKGFDIRGRQVTDQIIKCWAHYYPEVLKDELGRPIPYRFNYVEYDIDSDTYRYFFIPASLMSYVYPFYDSTEIITPAVMQI